MELRTHVTSHIWKCNILKFDQRCRHFSSRKAKWKWEMIYAFELLTLFHRTHEEHIRQCEGPFLDKFVNTKHTYIHSLTPVAQKVRFHKRTSNQPKAGDKSTSSKDTYIIERVLSSDESSRPYDWKAKKKKKWKRGRNERRQDREFRCVKE